MRERTADAVEVAKTVLLTEGLTALFIVGIVLLMLRNGS